MVSHTIETCPFETTRESAVVTTAGGTGPDLVGDTWSRAPMDLLFRGVTEATEGV